MFTSKTKENTKEKASKTSKQIARPVQKKNAKKRKPSKELLVLDMGSKTTKLVVGKYTGKHLIVNMINGTVNFKNSCLDGKIVDKDAIQNTVKNLIATSGVKIKNTVITVESTELIRRELEVANVPDIDVLGVATYGMGQYLPSDISSYLIQVKNIELFEDNGTKKKKVSVGVMPKSIGLGYVELTDALNLEREAMDINSNALEKLITLEIENDSNSQFRDKNVVFIDMGHSFFNISIYADGKYLFNKVLNIGGAMVDIVISDIMNVTLDEAEMIKIDNSDNYTVMEMQYKFASMSEKPKDKENMALYQTLDIYDSWTTEINQVLKYYTTRNRSNSIDEVYIYGGCSFINGIEDYFEKKLQLKTKDFINFRCIQLPTLELNKNILNYLNAIGALIRD